MSPTMAAHQPLFFPYLGYFERMKHCDIFVIRDDTQFAKRNFHHRNRIRVPESGEAKLKWLTVPVDKSARPLHQVEIKQQTLVKNRSWHRDIGLQLEGCYGGTPFFRGYYPRIQQILASGHRTLVELNMELISQFCEWFGIDVKLVLATEIAGFEPTGDATEDLVLLTQLTDCQTYLSGDGAKVYIEQEPFERAGLEMVFQGYEHCVYQQGGLDFVPYLACLDALFHVGEYPSEPGPKSDV